MLLSLYSIILETDGAAIASRVSRPRTDTTDIIINEQTIMNACMSLIRVMKTSLLSVAHPCMPIRDRLELEGPDGQAYRPTLDQAGRGRKIDGDHRLELERVGKKVHMGLTGLFGCDTFPRRWNGGYFLLL